MLGTSVQTGANSNVGCIYGECMTQSFLACGVSSPIQPVDSSVVLVLVPCPCWSPCTTPSLRPPVSEDLSLHCSNLPSPVSVRLQRHLVSCTHHSVGILISYWIAYGTNYIGGTTYPGQSDAAWRVPLGIQLVPALVLCIGVYWLPFSPRWLMLRGTS
mgnify:CR=1 FL=1